MFFLLSSSALPVCFFYYLKSRESWILPYMGIQFVAGIYMIIDVLYLGALSRVIPSISETAFCLSQTMLRSFLMLLIPIFIYKLFNKKKLSAVELGIMTDGAGFVFWALIVLIFAKESGRLSVLYLSNSTAATALAFYVFVTALRIKNKIHKPMYTINFLFILAGPIYIIYLILFSLGPVFGKELFAFLPISFTNMSYAVWNMIFLWYLVQFMARNKEKPEMSGPFERFLKSYDFTERENEVLTYAIKGYANKQIAGELGITDNTVKTHLFNAFQKIGIHTRIELINRVYAQTSAGNNNS